MVWVRTSCICARACVPACVGACVRVVCHPSVFERPKKLLSERHHCIFSGERGHKVWTDMGGWGVYAVLGRGKVKRV